MPYGASLQNLVFRLRNVQGEQGDWAVKSLTCVREPTTQESVSLTRVSTAFSQKSCSNLFERDFGISNKCRRLVRLYISFSVSNANVPDGRWFG